MSAELAQTRKERRDALLDSLTASIPYVRFLNVDFMRMGDELTGRLNFSDTLIGNPMIPALHGGVVSAFLEITAQTQLTWDLVWPKLEAGGEAEEALLRGEFPRTAQNNRPDDRLPALRPSARRLRARVRAKGRAAGRECAGRGVAGQSRPAHCGGAWSFPDARRRDVIAGGGRDPR